MALWLCRRCGTRFAVGLPYCPQCTSTDVVEDGTPESEAVMAKISATGGVTDATVPETMPENASDEVAAVEEDAESVPAHEPGGGEAAGKDSGSAADADSAEGPPRINDPKAAWVDWATSKGWTGDPDTVTKAELQRDYGYNS